MVSGYVDTVIWARVQTGLSCSTETSLREDWGGGWLLKRWGMKESCKVRVIGGSGQMDLKATDKA